MALVSTPAWPVRTPPMMLATPEAARSTIDGLQAEMVQCEWRSSQAEAYAACLTAEASKQRSIIRSLKDQVDSRVREASVLASLQAEVVKQREAARSEAERRIHAERSAQLKERQLDVLEGTVHALELRQRELTAAVDAAGACRTAADAEEEARLRQALAKEAVGREHERQVIVFLSLAACA